MMKKILCAALLAAVGTVGLAACDSAPPPDAADSRPDPSESTGAVEASAEPAAPAKAADSPPPESEETAAAREALTAALRDADIWSRTRTLSTQLPALGPAAVPVMQEILADPIFDLGVGDFELLVRYWATHEPLQAAQWALLKSPPSARIATVTTAFRLWAESDPQAAMMASQRRVAQIGDVRDAVQVALVKGWFSANPEELTLYIRDLGLGFSRQRSLATFILEMIRTQGNDAVVRWAESLPGDDVVYKTAVYRQVGAALPLFEHDAGIRWCEAHCDGPYGNNLRSIIARRWVLHDGAAALAWLLSAPDSHEKEVAVRAAFAVWGRTDRAAAVAWMADQTSTGEPEAWLRPLIPVYARLLVVDSPTEALVWAERIESAEEREIVLTGVARRWRQVDEAAAEAWLVQSSLSEEALEKVRAPVRRIQPNG